MTLGNEFHGGVVPTPEKPRKRGRPRRVIDKRSAMSFSLAQSTLALLRKKVSYSERSDFVERAILRALESYALLATLNKEKKQRKLKQSGFIVL